METDPFRLRVQKRLADALREVTPANGFKSDFSGAEGTDANRVFRGRVYFGNSDPIPMLSILEEPVTPGGNLVLKTGSQGSVEYRLLLQGFVQDDKVNPTDPAHVALADVKQKLAQVKKLSMGAQSVFQFGSKSPTVIDISFDGGVVRPPDEVSSTAYFWLYVTLTLVEDHENPYA